ncbi:MAG: hypothetical protein U5L02_12385 [Rheinheimera sp.]|nr:hypothetical protein [Rheinheimera sp.]
MKTEQQLDALISQLAPELAPQRDLWPELSKRLAPRRQMIYRNWLGVAAAAVLTLWFWPPQPAIEPRLSAENALSTDDSGLLLAVSQQLQQQLNAEQTRQLKGLQQVPDGFTDWSRQLLIWDKAQGQIELALQFQPDDQKLIQQLQRLQQQQLNYIAKLVKTSELT